MYVWSKYAKMWSRSLWVDHSPSGTICALFKANYVIVALGVFLHAVGGAAAGRFYLPLKQVKNWAWQLFAR